MADIFVASEIEQNKEEPKKKEAQQTEKNGKPLSIGGKIGLFSTFTLRPEGLNFKDQNDKETVFLFLRKHFITNVPWIILSLILLFIPPIIWILTSGRNLFPFPLPPGYLIIVIGFYYLGVLTYIFISFLNWFFNVSLVTDERVVDIDYSDIVYHDVAVTKLDLIEDIDYTQAGFVRSFFDYGDLFIQTAGEKVHFDFLAIPKPKKATNIIENLMGGDKNV